MSKQVSLILSPALADLYAFEDKTVVVIDVLRATSTICAAFSKPFNKIVTVKEIDTARSLKDENTWIAGERNGEKVEGFDLGNSPLEILAMEKVEGSNLVLTSTNGTKCVEIAVAKKAANVWIGSMLNINALASMIKKDTRDLVIFCAAWKDKLNIEDTFMASLLLNRIGAYVSTCDSTLIAQSLYSTHNANPIAFFQEATHYQRLVKMGNLQDVTYCLQDSILDVVPALVHYKEGVSVFENIHSIS
jgi:2-phosphosulfolactate phosphatase